MPLSAKETLTASGKAATFRCETRPGGAAAEETLPLPSKAVSPPATRMFRSRENMHARPRFADENSRLVQINFSLRDQISHYTIH